VCLIAGVFILVFVVITEVKQGGHSSGKPGKVREFESGQGKVRENGKSQGKVRGD